MDFTPRQHEALLDAARAAIRSALAGQKPQPSATNDLDLLRPAGCFVTLHAQGGDLRGCVGRLEATDPVIIAVTTAAVSVLNDPRFRNNPITASELPRLEIELSILTPLRPAPGILAFDPLNDGVYLTLGAQAGCFLPQVAREHGWSREQLLSKLCTEKLGLPADSWQHPSARLMLFNTVIIGPEAFERAIISSENVKPIEA